MHTKAMSFGFKARKKSKEPCHGLDNFSPFTQEQINFEECTKRKEITSFAKTALISESWQIALYVIIKKDGHKKCF